jgi:hypothetical protein
MSVCCGNIESTSSLPFRNVGPVSPQIRLEHSFAALTEPKRRDDMNWAAGVELPR